MLFPRGIYKKWPKLSFICTAEEVKLFHLCGLILFVCSVHFKSGLYLIFNFNILTYLQNSPVVLRMQNILDVEIKGMLSPSYLSAQDELLGTIDWYYLCRAERPINCLGDWSVCYE